MNNSRDKKMIENPDGWPCYPFLPVMREGWTNDNFANPENIGVIHASRVNVVIRTNVWAIDRLSDVELEGRCLVYASVAALLTDGWCVD